jgi:hypothetical protein
LKRLERLPAFFALVIVIGHLEEGSSFWMPPGEDGDPGSGKWRQRHGTGRSQAQTQRMRMARRIPEAVS